MVVLSIWRTMTSCAFCYWLQGRLEIAKPETLIGDQIACIQENVPLTC